MNSRRCVCDYIVSCWCSEKHPVHQQEMIFEKTRPKKKLRENNN